MYGSLAVFMAVLGMSMMDVSAQAPIGPQLAAFLDRDHAPNAQVDLFVKGERAPVCEAIMAHGGVVKMSMGHLVSARLPVDQVRSLAADRRVKGFEFNLDQGTVLNDSMRVHNRVVPVHIGVSPLPQAYDGTGVIVGVIDSGMDLDHPDFQNSDGTTRVLKYWDQNLPFDAQLTPLPYGYGRAWDSTAINAGQCPAVDQPQFFGHGSTVTGTLAGNGLATGAYMGVAPMADMVIVSSDFDLPNWRASVADAVKYILDEADARGMPAVINASLGTYLGSHDGMDAAALFVDSLLNAAPGRVMVCASGNSGQFGVYHVENMVNADTSFTWYKYKPTPNAFGYGVVYFDLWADTADLSGVRYAIGADRVAPTFRFRGRTPFHSVTDHLGQMGRDTLWSLSGNRLGSVDYLADLRGGQYHLEVHMQQPDSSAYHFRFMATGSGRYDGWGSGIFGLSDMVSTGLPSVAVFPDIANYRAPDGNKRTVDSWACSDQVLTVANYFNEVAYIDVNGNPQTVPGTEGDIVPRSSIGPTRDGRLKPDVAATGDITFSAGPLNTLASLITNEPHKVAPGGMHMRNGGTSMASPVVSGAVALYLQKCPLATAAEVKMAIVGNAFSDGFTGAVPNSTWGHGKLDVFATLVSSNVSVPLSQMNDTAICMNDLLPINGPSGMSTYLWHSGATTPGILVDQAGPVWLAVTNASGCTGGSDTTTIGILPLPPVPTITQVGNTLTSSIASTYQWFQDGLAIPGATDPDLDVLVSGNYWVVVSDGNGCSAVSDTTFVLVTSIGTIEQDAFLCWPSPTHVFVNVSLPS